ncbi:MAG: trypsin-like peptidase domain-containing protein [Nanoarchaeota archaeon]|nr:trypsin-like peptidase domain-containing protein [Nanoarchaeota archaeon]
MNKRNKLFYVVIVLLVVQLSSIIALGVQISQINNELGITRNSLDKAISENENKTYQTISEYEKKLLENQRQNQQNFNEISGKLISFNELFRNLSEQQSGVERDIGLLKLTQPGDFSEVIEESMQSVVNIATDKSAGTGFFVNDSGIIATNLHVLSGANRINVLTADGRTFRAEFIGGDKLRDVALLRIESSDFKSLSFADSDSLKVGNKVIAIGNPLGLSFTVTEGIVSALDRPGANGLNEYIQTDVSLNPGNSGGPLLDASGKVVGMNNFKIGGAENLGFALESNSVEKVINAIIIITNEA